jgi:hypothetical protein
MKWVRAAAIVWWLLVWVLALVGVAVSRRVLVGALVVCRFAAGMADGVCAEVEVADTPGGAGHGR